MQVVLLSSLASSLLFGLASSTWVPTRKALNYITGTRNWFIQDHLLATIRTGRPAYGYEDLVAEVIHPFWIQRLLCAFMKIGPKKIEEDAPEGENILEKISMADNPVFKEHPCLDLFIKVSQEQHFVDRVKLLIDNLKYQPNRALDTVFEHADMKRIFSEFHRARRLNDLKPLALSAKQVACMMELGLQESELMKTTSLMESDFEFLKVLESLRKGEDCFERLEGFLNDDEKFDVYLSDEDCIHILRNLSRMTLYFSTIKRLASLRILNTVISDFLMLPDWSSEGLKMVENLIKLTLKCNVLKLFTFRLFDMEEHECSSERIFGNAIKLLKHLLAQEVLSGSHFVEELSNYQRALEYNFAFPVPISDAEQKDYFDCLNISDIRLDSSSIKFLLQHDQLMCPKKLVKVLANSAAFRYEEIESLLASIDFRGKIEELLENEDVTQCEQGKTMRKFMDAWRVGKDSELFALIKHQPESLQGPFEHDSSNLLLMLPEDILNLLMQYSRKWYFVSKYLRSLYKVEVVELTPQEAFSLVFGADRDADLVLGSLKHHLKAEDMRVVLDCLQLNDAPIVSLAEKVYVRMIAGESHAEWSHIGEKAFYSSIQFTDERTRKLLAALWCWYIFSCTDVRLIDVASSSKHMHTVPAWKLFELFKNAKLEQWERIKILKVMGALSEHSAYQPCSVKDALANYHKDTIKSTRQRNFRANRLINWIANEDKSFISDREFGIIRNRMGSIMEIFLLYKREDSKDPFLSHVHKLHYTHPNLCSAMPALMGGLTCAEKCSLLKEVLPGLGNFVGETLVAAMTIIERIDLAIHILTKEDTFDDHMEQLVKKLIGFEHFEMLLGLLKDDRMADKFDAEERNRAIARVSSILENLMKKLN